MAFDFGAVIKFFPYFLPAAWKTLEVTVLGISLGLVIGLGVAFAKLSENPVLNGFSRFYICVIRGTPLLLQLFYLYFGLRSLLGLNAMTSAVVALGIHNGAYIAEIFRGAVQSVAPGQAEAAKAIGMSSRMAMVRIIFPQAFKRAVPPLGNQFIIALKDSSLASAITIQELVLKSQQLASSNFLMMEMLTVAAVFYLFYTSIFTFVFEKIEQNLMVSDKA